MQTHWSLVVIGAGPAGMAAALEAARHGVQALVLDRQPEAGGQIFRSAGSAEPATVQALGKEYAGGAALCRAFTNAPVTFLAGAEVWHIAPGRMYFSHNGQSHGITADQIILATGGMERPVPLPGWTLPGVLGAGATDILLKSAGLLPEGPVVLCGNGPLLLQTVSHLLHFGVRVAGVVLTGNLSNPIKALPALPRALARPQYMAHGMGLGLNMALRTRCYPGATGLLIEKEKNRLRVSFRFAGKTRQVEGTTVLLHEGVVSESRITRLAGVRHVWNPRQRYWHAEVDQWGNTCVVGLRCAGDVAGVRGAAAATARGTLAALDACCTLGKITPEQRNTFALPEQRRLRRCEAMQPFMDTVFAPRLECLQPADSAIVCRCEELTAKNLREAILAGSYSPDGLKSQARPGMGTCQGRMCAAPVAEMIAQAHNIPLESIDPYRAQPPLFPLRFGELASLNAPPEGL